MGLLAAVVAVVAGPSVTDTGKPGQQRPTASADLKAAPRGSGPIASVAVSLPPLLAKAPEAVSPSNAAPLLSPSHGVLIGAYVQPTGAETLGGIESAVAGLNQQLGRKLAIDQLFKPWNSQPPVAMAQWDISQGLIPMISWSGPVTSQVTSGSYDGLIRTWAQQLRDLHSPVLLRWFWEMDLSSNASRAVSPASYIAAWRHIHDIFASVGATNVEWVWCPDASAFNGQAQQFYPGSDYVDWVGADGYNWAPKRGRWRTFAQIFGNFYQWGVSSGKPLIIPEFGAIEGQPGQKAAWIRQAGQEIQSSFPDLRAVVYFDDNHQNFNMDFNWRLDSSPSAMEAFRALAAQPYFATRSLRSALG